MNDANSPRRTDYQASDDRGSQENNNTFNQRSNRESKNGTLTVQETLRDELRAKYPSRAKRAAESSKAAAIALQCAECVGGSSREAKRCELRDCFLWPHAFGRAANGGDR